MAEPKQELEQSFFQKEENINESDLERIEENAEKNFRVYRYRYFNLFIYVLGMIQISIMQTSFSPQAAELIQVYKKSTLIYNFTSLIHMIVHVPMSFPANYIVEKYGTKVGNTIGCIFALIACWIKCFVNYSFNYAILGQFFVGCANPFIINAISKISSNWFYPAQRAFITGILSFFSTVSGIIGLLIPGIYFSSYTTNNDDPQYTKGKKLTFDLLLFQAIIVSLFAIVNLIFYKDKPLTPPSYSSKVQREEFGDSLKFLIKNKTYLLITLCFSLIYGSFIDFAVILGQVISPYGFGTTETTISSIICVASGILGSVVLLRLLKKTFQYKRLAILCIISSTLSIILFAFMLQTELFALVLIPCIVLGFFIIPIIPIMLELANEVCFPVGEAIVSGFLYSISHVIGFVLGSGFSLIIESGSDKKSGAFWCICTFGCVFTVGLFSVFLMKQTLNRTNAERIQEQERNKLSTEDFYEENNVNN
ncbi:major facilitator superfamily protein, putative [Ichthyophthirius multifiliis]|uniref:Major facilitator superfamily protein, putative n=1 Tax=Ichthyophthirius multifiliis TaxID=5932 RepID=G0QRZ0_ICHMU|nr:major facilitator superfamily protein, putative [Ichthyophthirius multifiliis]EGR32020.1 major facilitator superfamily protein, putative [Ichthyophthirius multifiliis]|eukprot:XP_004035506.1 major facilitator superfamily protein, putative [Ichthyophthirius multifiliis]